PPAPLPVRAAASRRRRHDVADPSRPGGGRPVTLDPRHGPQWRVPLPEGVRCPFEVYVNGVLQELGTDYRVSEGELVFGRELVRQKLSGWAWLPGVWGVGT